MSSKRKAPVYMTRSLLSCGCCWRKTRKEKLWTRFWCEKHQDPPPPPAIRPWMTGLGITAKGAPAAKAALPVLMAVLDLCEGDVLLLERVLQEAVHRRKVLPTLDPTFQKKYLEENA